MRIAIIVVIILAIFTIILSVYTVPAGYRGVLKTFGSVDLSAKEEGIHMKIPIAQSVTDMEVRTQKVEVDADSTTSDLQDVQTTIALHFHIIPSDTPKLYQEVGMEYKDRIINPIMQEAAKAIMAKYRAEELITKRPEVRNEIKSFLIERLQKYHIIVDDFNIVNFQFSEEFDKAIEQKVTAEQLKLKAERDLERIKIEKEQMITQAQAQAESLRLQKMEVTPELVRLRQIEMMIKAIEKWDGVMPQATSGMPFIDVSPKQETIV